MPYKRKELSHIMDKIRANLYDLIACISKAQDLVSTKLSNHQPQVAYLSFRLAEHIGLPTEMRNDIFFAALIHDIGALSSRERLELVELEPINANNHGFRGAKLLEGFKPLQNAAGIIKYHHLPWNDGGGSSYMGEQVSLASHIVHLADRTCALVSPKRNIITQLPDIISVIRRLANSVFKPDLVEALSDLSAKEYIWLDLISSDPGKRILDTGMFNTMTLEIDDLVDLASIFSHIIDFRSRFTARHSAGVAKTAEKLAKLVGFSPYECKMMLIAGYLHDLGKIAISDEILEKPSKLNEDEYNVMRAHSYYTYYLLNPLRQLRTIAKWASSHHEKLDGTGYPFHISGDSLSLGSRIMAVADVFTAITENRPYRQGMDYESTKKILRDMVVSNALDKDVVDLLIDNFHEINSIREKSQIEAARQYEDFLRSCG